MASWFGEREGTHVRIYEREDCSIREAVPPVAQERGWHACGGGFEREVRVKAGKHTKGKIVRPTFFDVSHPTRERETSCDPGTLETVISKILNQRHFR